MQPIIIRFSRNQADQQFLGQAGGSISFTACGLPVFRFDNRMQYELYVNLKKNGDTQHES
ncbi:hypothetical protein P4T89_05610 [Bacillus nakamurai]|uniref:Uncharacterized protein n=1 Tax=Bacillus nakamurai TaxID=1793963 RepID=A0A150F427_9BACI|nr:hypothetical protein [Bacillus nakamurai]KXZ13402.1 hypothetical protein AXI58_04475 [Bacillus nakamurai]MCC9024150.1 hypothetical protein [Bacillus nakamurai]MED1227093.1 hypothetical protein [Bacillus nakamurai]